MAQPKPQENIVVSGVPFRRAALRTPPQGAQTVLQIGGARANWLYVLGCHNSIEVPNPAWGGGRTRENFFGGDNLGTLTVRYKSGARDAIPMILG